MEKYEDYRWRDPYFCLYTVKREGNALKYVIHQTDEICLAAVEQDGLALQFVEHQNDRICLAAVEQNPLALEFVKRKTKEIIKTANRKLKEELMPIEKDRISNDKYVFPEGIKEKDNFIHNLNNGYYNPVFCDITTKIDPPKLNTLHPNKEEIEDYSKQLDKYLEDKSKQEQEFIEKDKLKKIRLEEFQKDLINHIFGPIFITENKYLIDTIYEYCYKAKKEYGMVEVYKYFESLVELIYIFVHNIDSFRRNTSD